MARTKKWSRVLGAVAGTSLVIGVGTVAAQSMGDPWWIESGIVDSADAVTNDGSVAISAFAFSGSLAKAKQNHDTTGEYIGCRVTSVPDNGQFLDCAARDADGNTVECSTLYLGSELDLRKVIFLNAVASINSDSYLLVSYNGEGECDTVSVTQSSADFLASEGDDGGVDDCSLSNSTNLGAFGGNPVSVSNDGCAVVTQFAKPFFQYGPNRTMQLQNPGGNTSYPLSYEYEQACTGASGTGQFNGQWHDQFLPGLSDQCPLFIKLQGAGGSAIQLSYF